MIVLTMGKEFSTTPQVVPHVETKHRRIGSPVPHPDSVALLERMREVEPLSMRGMPPIVWDKAQDIYVFDKARQQVARLEQRRARDQCWPCRTGDLQSDDRPDQQRPDS